MASPFQLALLTFIAAWLAVVFVRFRRSTPVLVGGLAAVGLASSAALASGWATPGTFGIGAPPDPWRAALVALGGLGAMLAWSPVADRIATRFVARPPTLHAFRALQQGFGRLVLGIAIAWALGGFLEELAFRGVVLPTVEALLTPVVGSVAAQVAGVLLAAAGAGVIHLYQGPRAVIIITQLSVLFGLVFLISGHCLWAAIACHGLYDTIAFIRFALGKSRYSKLDAAAAPPAGD